MRTVVISTLLLGSFLCSQAIATSLTVSIPIMPIHSEAADKGVLVDFARALAKSLGYEIDIKLVPFTRSMRYVVEEKVDFHLPLIKPQHISNDEVDFIYSNETIFFVNFVLYFHKNSPLDIDALANYVIETDTAHLPYFPQLSRGSNCILCSLKNVHHGMTDGYIFADTATDPLLLKHKSLLNNIRRQLFQRFAVKVIFPKSEKGQQMNKKVSAVIIDMRKSGQLDALLNSVNQPYKPWQLD